MTENGKRIQVKFSQDPNRDPNRGCAHVTLTENTALACSVTSQSSERKEVFPSRQDNRYDGKLQFCCLFQAQSREK